MEIIFLLIGIFYIVYTLRFAIQFNRTYALYTAKQRFIHNVAIWVVPFIWIALLKQTMVTTPGSHQIKKKRIGTSDYNQASGGYAEDSYESHDHSTFDGGSDADGY